MSKTKKPCNICEIPNILTKDHVPPRCCSNKGKINFYRLFDKNFNPVKKPRQFQKGIVFETLCEKCNTERLGAELDSSLGDFQLKIIDAVSKCTKMSDTITVRCEINKVCKSVIGHLLAAMPHYVSDGIECHLREYFLDKTDKQVKNQHLYFWINIEKRVAIARNVGIALDPIFNGAVISLFKFPGAAFMLSDKTIDDRLVDLFGYTTSTFGEEVEISVDLMSVYSKSGEARTAEWPLIATDNRLFILSDSEKDMPMFSTLLDI